MCARCRATNATLTRDLRLISASLADNYGRPNAAGSAFVAARLDLLCKMPWLWKSIIIKYIVKRILAFVAISASCLARTRAACNSRVSSDGGILAIVLGDSAGRCPLACLAGWIES